MTSEGATGAGALLARECHDLFKSGKFDECISGLASPEITFYVNLFALPLGEELQLKSPNSFSFCASRAGETA